MSTLLAFEAAARLLSFTRAGEEVGLSQSAVSRQIQQLEERLGFDLFRRRHKEIELTRAGTILNQAIQKSLDEIRLAIETIEATRTNTLTVAATMAVSSYWLMPGLASFRSQFPQANIRLVASDQPFSTQGTGADFAIAYGDGQWHGYEATRLFDEEVFPVCSRDYLKDRQIDHLRDLSNETLIGMELRLNTVIGWTEWLAAYGVNVTPRSKHLAVSNYDLAIRAALGGQGIALMWSFAAPLDLLNNGTLVRPVPEVVKTGKAEYLLYDKSEAMPPLHEAFLQWITDYAATTRAAIHAVDPTFSAD